AAHECPIPFNTQGKSSPMFSHFTIGTRLIAGFILTALIAAVVGVVALRSSASMNDLAEAMYSRELMGLSHIKEANVALLAVGRARSNYLLATSEDERARHLDSIKKNSASAKQRIDLARPLFVSDRAKVLFAQIEQLWGTYQRDLHDSLELAKRKPLADRDVELSNALAKVREAADNLDTMFAELNQQKEQRAQAANDEIEALYYSSRNMMFALIGFGVMLRSPSDSASATATAFVSGIVTLRLMMKPRAIPSTTPKPMSANIMLRLL
ncbi:MCP four helix bundle domain-containing protein, partial [Leptospira sp. SA-E8]|uniref:MCP four helix bundle domain-containing protein n=1 Tax=Leptospira sp. SA-E8 TaxID=3422259 RepID=UPI003EBE0FDD